MYVEMFYLERLVEIFNKFQPLGGLSRKMCCICLKNLGLRVQLLLVDIGLCNTGGGQSISWSINQSTGQV